MPNTKTQDPSEIAIKISALRKEYRMYNNLTDQAIDVLGLSWLRFWQKISYKTFPALDGIDLEIRHGQRVGIVGRNGAGKSTLLKLIAGNYEATSGKIEVNGDIQALMQTGFGFHSEFTGMENIKSALMFNGLDGDELEAAVDDIVDFCELGEFIDQPIKAYSLGMKARIQFATATAIKPDIVIIDEVLGAGDAYFVGKSNERMKRLTNHGATLLIVSHSMSQILQFSDRVIWMHEGRVNLSGEPLDVINQYEEFIHKVELERSLLEAKVGTSVNDTMSELPKALQERNAMIAGKGADWGGMGPLRIQNVSFIDENGNPIKQIRTGQPFGVCAEIISDKPGSYQCTCLFVIYDEMSEVVSKISEPEREYVFEGNTHRVVAWFDNNPVGEGEYVLSGGLYRDFDPIVPLNAHRYHILSRGCRLWIKSLERDNSKIQMVPSWQNSILDFT